MCLNTSDTSGTEWKRGMQILLRQERMGNKSKPTRENEIQSE